MSRDADLLDITGVIYLPVDRERLAWAAGFFDGEGYVGLSHTNFSVRVSQKSPEVLHTFRDAIGFGTVGKAGTVYQYYVYGFEKVQAVMALLWSWLSLDSKAKFLRAMEDEVDR